jgi:MIP family channel proteins
VSNHTYTLPQKLATEFLGTFAVVFTAAGAICAEQYLRSANQAGGGALGYALAYGLAVGIAVSAVAHISGGHLNPAVTIGVWVTRRIGWMHALLYCIAQMLGGLVAAYALVAVLPDTGWRFDALRWITPETMSDFSRWNAMLLEGVLTAIVVFVYFATMVDAGADSRGESASPGKRLGGLIVGLAVAVETLVAAPFTGAALNPARSFGPALATHHWQNHGVYWVGPLFGGALAAVIYNAIFLADQPRS